jgi:hypothetical protein
MPTVWWWLVVAGGWWWARYLVAGVAHPCGELVKYGEVGSGRGSRRERNHHICEGLEHLDGSLGVFSIARRQSLHEGIHEHQRIHFLRVHDTHTHTTQREVRPGGMGMRDGEGSGALSAEVAGRTRAANRRAKWRVMSLRKVPSSSCKPGNPSTLETHAGTGATTQDRPRVTTLARGDTLSFSSAVATTRAYSMECMSCCSASSWLRVLAAVFSPSA